MTLLLGKKGWIDVKSVGPAWQDDEAGWPAGDSVGLFLSVGFMMDKAAIVLIYN